MLRIHQAHKPERFVNTLLSKLSGNAIKFGEEQQVFKSTQPAFGRNHLRHVSEIATHRTRIALDVESSHKRCPRSRWQQRREHFDGCTLASTVWAEQSEDTAGRNGDVQRIHCAQLSEAASQVRGE